MSLIVVQYEELDNFENLKDFLNNNLIDDEDDEVQDQIEELQTNLENLLQQKEYFEIFCQLFSIFSSFEFKQKLQLKVQKNITILAFWFFNKCTDKDQKLDQLISTTEKTFKTSTIEYLGLLFNMQDLTDRFQKQIILQILKIAEKNAQQSIVLNTLTNINAFVLNWNLNIQEIIEFYEIVFNFANKEDIKIQLALSFFDQVNNANYNVAQAFIEKLVIFLINSNQINQQILDSINQKCIQLLKVNNINLYNIFFYYFTGNFQEFIKLNLDTTKGINQAKIQDRVRVNSIPRFCQIGSNIRFEEISKELNVTNEEVENLIILAIHQNLIEASIDQYLEQIEVENILVKYFEEADWKLMQAELITKQEILRQK